MIKLKYEKYLSKLIIIIIMIELKKLWNIK